MDLNDRIKRFKEVFSPKTGEKVLFLVDIPHNNIKDNKQWLARRELVQEWYNAFKLLGEELNFSVKKLEYKATGKNNAPLPNEITDIVRNYNLIIAMNEYSASSSLYPICIEKNSVTRCASMPGIEEISENTALNSDYAEVKIFATAIGKFLTEAIGAEILFSTGDTLFIDIRNRKGESDTGECSEDGQFINFPSGEGCIAPYEATGYEIKEFGKSKTKGILPVKFNGEIAKFEIDNNSIVKIIGDGKKAEELRSLFKENNSRRNIAELGIGCNPNAVITGNIIEDEKVGLHIAYGMSSHLGGKIDSDIHIDICYSKGCPIEGKCLDLIYADGRKIRLIENAMLKYDLLK